MIQLPCEVCETLPTHTCVGAHVCERHCRRPQWHFPEEKAVEAVPPPTVQCRRIPETGWHLLPRSAKAAAKASVGGGWSTAVTESCGPYLGAGGEVLEHDVWALAVRAHKGSRLVTMLWVRRGETWGFEVAVASEPRRTLGAKAALEILKEG